jgi:uncharacterized protein (DUF2147 family)
LQFLLKMSSPHKDTYRSLLLLSLLAGSLTGCAAAAVGAAGAVGGVAYTDRGAEGDVKGNVEQVNRQATQALKSMGIQITGSELKNSGREQSISGKAGGTDVSVKMRQASAGTTHIEVIAKESTLRWNKDYAKEILAKIVQQS